jgi:hypothetical protein
VTGERLVSAVEAERLAKVPAGTVRRWASEGRLFSVGLDPASRPLYRLSEVEALRDSTRRRARRTGET